MLAFLGEVIGLEIDRPSGGRSRQQVEVNIKDPVGRLAALRDVQDQVPPIIGDPSAAHADRVLRHRKHNRIIALRDERPEEDEERSTYIKIREADVGTAK